MLVDSLHLGPRRALAAEAHHRLDLRLGTLEDGLDRSVGAVSRPARDPARLGHAPNRVAKEDPLNAPVDDDAPADHGPLLVVVVVAGGLDGEPAAVELVGRNCR
jgi:hypothetical protein